MPDIIESTCQLFADDAKVFCKVSTNDDSMQLQDDMIRLSEWSKLWKLPFNIGKCKSLHIGCNNNRTIYKMNNQELKQVVRPHLEYCNVIRGAFYKGDIITVEKIQRRATKFVPELKNKLKNENRRR